MKTIQVPGVTSCAPNAADLDGARDADCRMCGYNDRFKVAVPEPGLVSVERLHNPGGWGMDLTFTCEAGVLSGSGAGRANGPGWMGGGGCAVGI